MGSTLGKVVDEGGEGALMVMLLIPESSQMGLSFSRRRSLLVSKVKELMPAVWSEWTRLVILASGEPSPTRMRAAFSEAEMSRTRGGLAGAPGQSAKMRRIGRSLIGNLGLSISRSVQSSNVE